MAYYNKYNLTNTHSRYSAPITYPERSYSTEYRFLRATEYNYPKSNPLRSESGINKTENLHLKSLYTKSSKTPTSYGIGSYNTVTRPTSIVSTYPNRVLPRSSYNSIPNSISSLSRPLSTKAETNLKNKYHNESTDTKVVNENYFGTGYSSSGNNITMSRYYALPSCRTLTAENVEEMLKSQDSTGLLNLGNTCYINTILQCLAHTKPLATYVLTGNYETDSGYKKRSLFSSFAAILKKLWLERNNINLMDFKDEIQGYIGKQFAGYKPQDAHEFMRFLLDKLHLDLNRSSRFKKFKSSNEGCYICVKEFWNNYIANDNSYIVDTFAGVLESTLQCRSCNHKSITYEVFWDISLSIPLNGQVTLDHLLKEFIKAEPLIDVPKLICSNCKSPENMYKSYSFQRLPKILVFNFKRFDRNGNKLYTNVQYPEMGLDMAPYISLSASVTGSRKYELYAIVQHSGTTSCGHYFAYCKKANAGKWVSYSDTTVSSSAVSLTSRTAEAYILFYQAVEKY